MFWDDLRRVLSGAQLYRFDSLISVRLVPMLYALGLAAIGLWAIDFVVTSFASGFAEGLWALIQLLVFGPLIVVALRIACETALVYFRAHRSIVQQIDGERGRDTLLEEIGDALHDLAEDDFDADSAPPPLPGAPPSGGATPEPSLKGGVRRTARRTPPPRP